MSARSRAVAIFRFLMEMETRGATCCGCCVPDARVESTPTPSLRQTLRQRGALLRLSPRRRRSVEPPRCTSMTPVGHAVDCPAKVQTPQRRTRPIDLVGDYRLLAVDETPSARRNRKNLETRGDHQDAQAAPGTTLAILGLLGQFVPKECEKANDKRRL